MKKHTNLLALCLALFFSLPLLQAQTLTYQVDGDDLFSSECGDCSSGPDYRFRLRVNDQVNTAWSDWNTDIEDSANCEWLGISNFSWRNATAGDNNTVITVQLNAYEDDDFFCGGDDGDCGGYGTVGTNNLSDLAPCTWHYFTPTRVCDGITWGVEYSYRYEYDDLLPGSIAMASTTECAPYNPALISNTALATKWATYQWEMSTDGTTWTTIAGATMESYDPPSITFTTSYRRSALDCSGRIAYSNEVTYTLTPKPQVTLTLPSTIADCQASDLQNINGSGLPVGGVYSGEGVTDNGDGLTFALDPSAVAPGQIVITYTGPSSQQNFDNGVGGVSNITFGAISDNDFPNFVASPFQLTTTTILNQVNWSGFYANSNTPSPNDFTINIWTDNNGFPGSLVYNESIGNTAIQTPTSASIFGADIYEYEATIDFTAQSNTTYHISIFNQTANDTDDDWYWSYAASPDAFFESADNITFSTSGNSGKLDFQLSSEICPSFASALTEFVTDCPDDCLPFVIYTNTSTLPDSTTVENYIETNSALTEAVKVLNGQVVTMDAGDYIELNAGFEVELGADFHGYIEGCNPQ